MNEKTNLRPFQEKDADQLAYLANNNKISDNLRDAFPHPYSKDDALNFIKFCTNESPLRKFAIEYHNQLVGAIGLAIQDDVYKFNAELGYWLGEPYWGKGIMPDAIKQIVLYGFNDLNLVRIYSSIFDFNKNSIRVLEKVGFEFEGIGKSAVYKNKKLCNECRYAIINTKHELV